MQEQQDTKGEPMRSRPRRSVLGWSLIGLVCLLGLVCLCRVIGSSIRNRRVESTIAHFEESPSQAGAGALVGLLQSHAATTEQGSRILTLLRRPTITTRPTYAAGRPVGVALEQPFRLAFQDTLWHRSEIGIVEGGDRHITRRGDNNLPRTLHIRGLSAHQAKPGIHTLTVQGAYSVGFRPRGGLTKPGHWAGDLLRKIGLSLGEGWLPDRTYECEFEMPFDVTVGPEDQAETIKLVSSTQLNDAMANAFQLQSPRSLRPYRTASGQIRYPISEVIHYRDLPVSAVFRLTLHLSDEWGRRSSLEDPEPLVAQAGASGQRAFSCWLTEPGTYTGTIVLHPDPNRAYEDPAIETIWGRRLELPISFTIHSKLNSP